MKSDRLRLVTATDEVTYTAGTSKSIVGGGGSGGMDARVTQLEQDMRVLKESTGSIRESLIRIESKIDGRASAVDLAEIKGKIDAKASSADVTGLSGKIDEKPDTWKVVVIVLALDAIMGGSQLVKAISDAVHGPAVTVVTPQTKQSAS